MINIFKNKITRMVEKSKKIEGEIEVLKKQQKVKSENAMKANKAKQLDFTNTTNATIESYKAAIKIAESNIKTECDKYDQECRVEVDKIMNDYNSKILAKMNELNRTKNLIEAENKNNMDVMKPLMINAPTSKTLLENKSNKNN